MNGRNILNYILMTIGGLMALLSGGCTLLAFREFGELAIAFGIIPFVFGLSMFFIAKSLLRPSQKK